MQYNQTVLDNIPHLEIHGAVYGPKDVTGFIKSKIKDNSLCIRADNTTFGDSWVSILKTLVIFFSYGDSRIYHCVALENETVKIVYSDYLEYNLYATKKDDKLRVLSAIYGMKDATLACQWLVQDRCFLSFKAENSILGDGMVGILKTLVVLCELDGKKVLKVVKEHEQLTIGQGDYAYNRDISYFINLI